MGQSVRRVRIAAIVFNVKDELLVCRQNNHPFWVLPGGTLEPNETMEACVVRELKEETELDVVFKQWVGVTEFIPENPERLSVIDFFAWVTLKDPNQALVMATDENLNALKWLPFGQLEVLDLKPDNLKHQLQKHWASKGFESMAYWGA